MPPATIARKPASEELPPVANALNIILATIMAAALLVLAGVLLLPEFTTRWLLQVATVWVLCISMLLLNRRGYTRLASILLVIGLWALLAVSAVTGGGIATFAPTFFLITIFIAGLLLGSRAGMATALLSILTGLLMAVLEMTGHLPWRLIPYTPMTRWIGLTVLILIVMGLQHLGARTVQEALRRSRQELDDRKRAEAALKLAKERSEGLINTIDGIVWEADAKTSQFTFVSPQAERFLGYPRERWLVEPTFWKDHIHPDDREAAISYSESRTKGMQDHDFEYRMIAADGREVWLRDIVAVMVENNEPKTLRGIMVEVTERKQAEEELRTSERRFSKAFSLGPHRMGIIRLKDGVVLDVNDRWVHETGFQRSEIIGRSVFEMETLLRTAGKDEVRQLLATGKPFRDVELHLTTKTGEERVVLSSAEVFELRGEPCLLFAAHDITERKQADERISLLQMITREVAAAPDLTSALEVVLRRVCEKTGWALGQAWIPNPKENVLACCPAAYASAPGLDEFRESTKHLSFRPGQGLPGRVWATGQPAWIRDVTQDTNFPRAEFARKAGLKAGLGIPILSGEEVIAVLEFFLREPRDEDERLVEVISAVAAQIGLVMSRKQVEAALRASEQRFTIAFNSNPVLAAIARQDGGHFLAVNDTFIHAMGYSRDEVIGHNALELNLLVDTADRTRALQDLDREGSVHGFEARVITKKGDERVVLLSVEVIELEGERCLLLAGIDITERKLAEEALTISTKRLRALSARLQSAREEEGTRIAREIHDEMGSALTGMKWDLEKIDKKLSKSNNGPGITEARDRIGSITSLIESTINTVRRISSELRPGVLDDLGLVAAIDWQAQQFQSRTGIKYHPDTIVDTPNVNRESSTAVFRIFQEILTNVLRHAQANNLYVKLREQDGYLELEVRDDGRGITESERSNTKSLGLLGMQERALLVGGQVSIDGRNGEGTTVAVRVPLTA